MIRLFEMPEQTMLPDLPRNFICQPNDF